MFTFAEMEHAGQNFRCPWCLKDTLYMDYHDREWGRASTDDRHLFEMLILEMFQAGLSWHTILKKRENFRKAFSGFDVYKVAAYGAAEKEILMQDAGIIRNRLKIEAAVSNAVKWIDLVAEYGSFARYLWGRQNGQVLDHAPRTLAEIPATTPESDALAADLKQRGFRFMGSKVCYALMQSVGLVNDHLLGCMARNVSE